MARKRKPEEYTDAEKRKMLAKIVTDRTAGVLFCQDAAATEDKNGLRVIDYVPAEGQDPALTATFWKAGDVETNTRAVLELCGCWGVTIVIVAGG